MPKAPAGPFGGGWGREGWLAMYRHFVLERIFGTASQKDWKTDLRERFPGLDVKPMEGNNRFHRPRECSLVTSYCAGALGIGGDLL